MKIAIIGSTQYRDKFITLKQILEIGGNEVRIPAFDDHPELDELGVCINNRNIIEWADKVYLIWDRRSVGTVFDFGMVFMARKPLEIYYLEPKTMEGVMTKYSEMMEKIGGKQI
jgi:hypothetical protein